MLLSNVGRGIHKTKPDTRPCPFTQKALSVFSLCKKDKSIRIDNDFKKGILLHKLKIARLKTVLKGKNVLTRI